MNNKSLLISFTTRCLYIFLTVSPIKASASFGEGNITNSIAKNVLDSSWSVTPDKISSGKYDLNRVDDQKFSYVGRIYSDQIPKNTPPCSGVLVAPNLVLTAFHCINIKGIHATQVEFVTDQNESSSVTSYSYATIDLPRSMNSSLPIDEVLSIQNEDLVLLKLATPIQSISPIDLYDFKRCDYISSKYYAVGYSDYNAVGFSNVEKFQSEQKYKFAVLSMLRMDGLVLSGMSGGALVINCMGKDMLAGIVGMALGATKEAIFMLPYRNDRIRNEVLQSIGNTSIAEVDTSFVLSNQIPNTKKEIVKSYMGSNEGSSFLCYLLQFDPTLLQSVNFSVLSLSESNLRLLSCTTSADRYLLFRIRAMIAQESDPIKKSIAIKSLRAFLRTQRSEVKEILLGIKSDDSSINYAIDEIITAGWIQNN